MSERTISIAEIIVLKFVVSQSLSLLWLSSVEEQSQSNSFISGSGALAWCLAIGGTIATNNGILFPCIIKELFNLLP